LKAAGILDDYVHNATPRKLIQLFIEGINQHDHYILSLATASNLEKNSHFTAIIEDIETIKIKEITNLPENIEEMHAAVIEVEVTMYTKRNGKEKGKFIIPVSKASLVDPWIIHHEGVQIHLVNE
jgi:hypothetical protein